MGFDPNVLNEEERAAFDAALATEVTPDKWVGSAYSALRGLASGSGWTDEQREAALHILFVKAPDAVRNLGDMYDAGLL